MHRRPLFPDHVLCGCCGIDLLKNFPRERDEDCEPQDGNGKSAL